MLTMEKEVGEQAGSEQLPSGDTQHKTPEMSLLRP